MTRDELLDAMSAAFWGAYDAAPPGEGVVGAAEFGCLAAVLVALDGLSPPLAMAQAIGETGHYGRPRQHELVPRQGPGSVADARRQAIEECLRIVELARRRYSKSDGSARFLGATLFDDIRVLLPPAPEERQP